MDKEESQNEWEWRIVGILVVRSELCIKTESDEAVTLVQVHNKKYQNTLLLLKIQLQHKEFHFCGLRTIIIPQIIIIHAVGTDLEHKTT